MAHQPAAQFRRLDARQSQHAGRDGAHPPQPAAQLPGHGLPQVARHQHALHHAGTQRVGGYVAVAKPHHQHLALAGQQASDSLRYQRGQQLLGVRVAAGQVAVFQGDVFACVPAQQLGRAFLLDADAGVRDAAQMMRAHAHALHPSATLVDAFHGQIRPKSAHAPLPPSCLKRARKKAAHAFSYSMRGPGKNIRQPS